MTYNIYQDDELIKENVKEKEYTVEGLTPNTEYSFSISEVIGKNESEKSETITVTTKYSDVTSVEVTPKTNNLDVEATRQLSTTVKPSTAKQDVTYTSNADEIATVSDSGLVTAISEGEATITVKTVDGNHTDTATVNVTKPPEITTEEVTEKIDIVEYETIRNETEDLPKGEEEVVQEGKDGYTEVTYEVTYEDGVEVSREEINREVIDPVDEIINVGTYEEPEPDPEPEEGE